ncbi:MAG TPA: DUF340 domain-containing protein [Firmicutes bacterium]|jgi:hypothetical protein|nr:DUF340 domain-containing protein [Bacillota bacterium]
MANVMRIFVVTAILSLIGNFIGFDISPIAALPGMLILFVLVILGYWLSQVSPIKLPSIAYISALAIIASIPGVPGADFVNQYTGKVEFLALTTPILAYTGISIGKDLGTFKQQGLKIVLVTLLTFVGTYVGSAIIAEVVLRLTGVI